MEKQHISAQRKQRATLSIETKLQLLQRYMSEGVPEGAFVPRNMTEFRLWEDEPLGVMKIGSPNTLEQKQNKGLKLRAQELIVEIAKRNRRKKKGSNEEKLRAAVEEKDRLITNLTNQWHASQHECERAQQSERRLKNRVTELLRDNGELTRRITAIVPLQSA
jgi:hypothetical protein